MKNSLFLLTLTALFIFNAGYSAKPSDYSGSVSITMEGKTYVLKDLDWRACKASFENGEIQYLFRMDGSPVSLNLNFPTQAILEKSSATFQIPEANSPKTVIDLNFYNSERESSRMNKRIIFRKGTIQIDKLTKNSLKMSFEGEGGGMLESKKSFPITGEISVEY